MASGFDLYVTADSAGFRAELRLCDIAGNPLAWRELRLGDLAASRREALFDLRGYVDRYAGNVHPLEAAAPLDESELVRDLGVFLGREVLGETIMGHLAGEAPARRTLRVRLPEARGDDLAGAFARVPWEIARLADGEQALAQTNLLIRVLVGADEPHPEPVALEADEALRALLVFAESPGTEPLAARQERRQLLDLFHRDIYPSRRVEVDALAHGVTRERLVRQIQDRDGYHAVHWSGHGRRDELALHAEGDEPPFISGRELVELFSNAGGYIPHLVFLGACHSGDVVPVKGWAAFQARVERRRRAAVREARETGGEPLTPRLQEQPGYTGTAHALLEAGVPTVVAMRYAVGDDYACDLAAAFYARLPGHKRPKRADEALNQARIELLRRAESAGSCGYTACDHATPVLYGAADPGLRVPAGHSERPMMHPPLRIAELHAHKDFVGRARELARLGARWLEGRDERPVAVVRGLGGLGKTALAAEALDLDACVLIYRVEGAEPFSQAVAAAIRSAPDAVLCISDLVRLECLVGPIRRGNADLRGLTKRSSNSLLASRSTRPSSTWRRSFGRGRTSRSRTHCTPLRPSRTDATNCGRTTGGSTRSRRSSRCG